MTTSTSTTQLLTIGQVADCLRIDRRSVYRLIESGDLRAIPLAVLGRPRYRVREDDLAAFVEARTSPRVQTEAGER